MLCALSISFPPPITFNPECSIYPNDKSKRGTTTFFTHRVKETQEKQSNTEIIQQATLRSFHCHQIHSLSITTDNYLNFHSYFDYDILLTQGILQNEV